MLDLDFDLLFDGKDMTRNDGKIFHSLLDFFNALHFKSSFKKGLIKIMKNIALYSLFGGAIICLLFIDVGGQVATVKMITNLQNQIKLLSACAGEGANLTEIAASVEDQEGRIAALETKFTEIESQVTKSLANIKRLQDVNQIWRSNFQVVNRTFAELRKKIKFTRYAFILPVIPVKKVDLSPG